MPAGMTVTTMKAASLRNCRGGPVGAQEVAVGIFDRSRQHAGLA